MSRADPARGMMPVNIVHFARALRRAGLPIGSGRVIDAVRAVEVAGFTARTDFFWILHACFVSRPEHREVFAQVFRLYWRDPRLEEHMMSLLLPSVRGAAEERPPQPGERRAAEALLDRPPDLPPPTPDPDLTIDASETASAREKLRRLDFEQMTSAEMAEARRMLAELQLPVPPMAQRRTMASNRGHMPDWRRSLRDALRQGGELSAPARRERRERWPKLIVLCDISGSMSSYSRAVLHFIHAVANQRGQGWARVHAFTFGTRLTNITRHLRGRDVDAALARAGAEAPDWSGGTRIGESLRAFNRDWSRRVMGQGAVVLLITDGLDRGDPEALAREMQRLRLSARRVIWLNPLLRWEAFAPRAAGVRAMLPHVDSFRAGHNIAALEGLAAALRDPQDAGEKNRLLTADAAVSKY